jgi:hypothetical protein
MPVRCSEQCDYIKNKKDMPGLCIGVLGMERIFYQIIYELVLLTLPEGHA